MVGPSSPLVSPHELTFYAAGEADTPAKPLFRNVSLKEYYRDLDAVLAVCSDGPAKSFAFRRLKYLASKWNLYCLLNEYQEIADVKVGRRVWASGKG